MTEKKYCVFLLLVAYIIFTGCSSAKTATTVNEPLPVIFETDMGNDIDDALALDMLYKYADQKVVKLLAVSSNKNNPLSAVYVDIMNTWYGYPKVPAGKVVNGANSENDAVNYTRVVAGYLPAFKRTMKDTAAYPESVNLYRRILSKVADHSVVIISVGFSTNLARLLNSPPDRYTNLSGKELVAKKVKFLSVMAGSFEGKKMKEYNVIKDVPAARELFKEWPTEIVVSPFEVGEQIRYPSTSILNDFSWAAHHPMVIAYKSYAKMPYDRQTWDLTAVLYAVEGAKDYFSVSEPGTIEVMADAFTSFNPGTNGKHHYLKVNAEQAERVKRRFIELITTPPAALK
ncbi:nucleoside hydrolase [Agriterribacter sp.]|uniref:nucleoside hydrolase n=1 Tax=Agriterribacter sp. TaxID=2821509 RepID=UPI002CB263F9|nr:nucleoside hydrolase [Agriterribacter sp.]HRO47278.1 nucleoside hydrolase [Agriterribacter sp.]HRQ16558.1 nucleoside hydrolase [Agriterribacter sp.]